MSIRRFVQIPVALLALGLVSSAGATPPGTNGRIVFSSTRNGSSTSELYSMNSDGSSERRLTWTSETEQDPAWSPDGTRIAYERAGGGERWRIWVMNADGSGQTRSSLPQLGWILPMTSSRSGHPTERRSHLRARVSIHGTSGS